MDETMKRDRFVDRIHQEDTGTKQSQNSHGHVCYIIDRRFISIELETNK